MLTTQVKSKVTQVRGSQSPGNSDITRFVRQWRKIANTACPQYICCYTGKAYNHDGNIIRIPIYFHHGCVKNEKKIEKIVTLEVYNPTL